MKRYINELLTYLQQNNFYSTIHNLTSKSENKAILTMAWSLKKLKGMDNPLLVQEVCIIAFQDFWFVKNKKANVVIKVHLKQVADAKKKA